MPSELIGNRIEGQVFDLVLEEAPLGDLNETLIRQSAGVDPCPGLSDEELLECYRGARKESEHGH